VEADGATILAAAGARRNLASDFVSAAGAELRDRMRYNTGRARHATDNAAEWRERRTPAARGRPVLAPFPGFQPMHDVKRMVKRGFDRASKACRSDDPPNGRYKGWVEELAQHVEDGAPVLDLGCGCGLPATKLLAERYLVMGVDFSRTQIDRAERLVPDAQFVCNDVTALKFHANSFAAITAFYLVSHIPLEEQPMLFRKIALWLRPGGLLMCTVGHLACNETEDRWLGVRGATMAWNQVDDETYKTWMADAGFDVRDCRYIPELAHGGQSLVLAKLPGEA
jgi:2-polyprenyl-3-methyl-5-hydroxy-6-metoxy-1,4-benzoquinol methylase